MTRYKGATKVMATVRSRTGTTRVVSVPPEASSPWPRCFVASEEQEMDGTGAAAEIRAATAEWSGSWLASTRSEEPWRTAHLMRVPLGQSFQP